MLGFGVIGLKIVVTDGPCRRHAAVMAQLAEILFPKPQQRSAIKFGVSPDKVVRAWHELVAVLVAPWLDVVVPAFANDGTRIPVFFFPRHKVAALEKENLLAGRSESIRQRSASRSCSNDDDVVVIVSSHCNTSPATCREALWIIPGVKRKNA